MSFTKSTTSPMSTYLLKNDSGSSAYGTIKSQPTRPDHSPIRSSRPSSPLTASSRRDRDRPARIYDLEDLTDDEAMEDLVDISYSQLMRNYSLVPISSLVFLILLICLFTFAWPPSLDWDPVSYPYSPHWPEFFTGCAGWIVSYSLRIPIFLVSTFFGRYTNTFTLVVSATMHTAIEEGLRLASIMILQIRLSYWPGHPTWIPYADPQDDAFRQVFWFALGWAMVEVVWSISQGYDQLALYRDVLRETEEPRWDSDSDDGAEVESISHRFVHSAFKSVSPPEPRIRGSKKPMSGLDPHSANGDHFDLDSEMTQLINIQSRTELESVYGVPLPNIPVFISILQRIDSILLAVGLSLVISSSYLTQLVAHPSSHSPSRRHPVPPEPTDPAIPDVPAALIATLPTYIIILIVHASLAVMWTEALPRIGVHTASYTGLLVSLGVFFAGLASWGALS